MDSGSARQQIVDSIKNSNTILVTVSTNPSVDELSAALGLTVLLNNLEKRATSVVSGAIPPAITFLDPHKTFTSTVDSLRDFIIALDKEKADHLRYKVEGDSVKIFITPYRTTLSDKDLEFSQGNYNVELVIALGVKDQDHLDKALIAHGRILHDATVATITAGAEPSTLGSIDWRDAAASSLCEMLVSLSEALKTDTPLLDEQISTALLTGIVSSTDRFSNERTSSRVMTMAAQLMAAGANQQLIAAKLQEAHDIGPNKRDQSNDKSEKNTDDTDDSMLNLSDNKSRSNRDRKKKKKNDNALQVERNKHDDSSDDSPSSAFAAAAAVSSDASVDDSGAQPKIEDTPDDTQDRDKASIVDTAVAAADSSSHTEKQLEDQLSQITSPAAPSMTDIQNELASATPAAADQPPITEQSDQPDTQTPELTATSDGGMPGFEAIDVPAATPKTQPAQPTDFDSQSDERTDTSPFIQSTHDNASYIQDSTSGRSFDAPLSSVMQDTTVTARAADVNPFSTPLPQLEPADSTTSLDQAVFNQLDQTPPATVAPQVANVATDDVQPSVPSVADLPSASVQQPAPIALPPLPQMPDFSSFPPPPPMPSFDQFAALPPQPPLSGEQTTDVFSADTEPSAPPQTPPPATPPEPGQFQIPSQ